MQLHSHDLYWWMIHLGKYVSITWMFPEPWQYLQQDFLCLKRQTANKNPETGNNKRKPAKTYFIIFPYFPQIRILKPHCIIILMCIRKRNAWILRVRRNPKECICTFDVKFQLLEVFWPQKQWYTAFRDEVGLLILDHMGRMGCLKYRTQKDKKHAFETLKTKSEALPVLKNAQ